MSVQLQVASRDVLPGDTIPASMLRSRPGDERMAKVISVRKVGANVAIETDLGVGALLPVNRSVTVWR